MLRETTVAKSERAAKIIDGLKRAYPEAHCELKHSNPLELLIATILSAQCTDKKVNEVTPALFRKYRTAAEYAQAPTPELEEAIRSLGFFRNKAKSIQTCCRQIAEQHGGEVPRAMEALTQLAGVGRKTANVVLGNAFGINEGIVVDTHVLRLSQRLGLTAHTVPEKINPHQKQAAGRLAGEQIIGKNRQQHSDIHAGLEHRGNPGAPPARPGFRQQRSSDRSQRNPLFFRVSAIPVFSCGECRKPPGKRRDTAKKNFLPDPRRGVCSLPGPSWSLLRTAR